MIEATLPLPLPRARVPADARLRAVVDNHYDALWRALRRLGVAPDAVEDAAQQVLLVMARRLDDVVPGAERSFLIGTAVRVASDHRKKKARSREVVDERAMEEKRASTPDAEELLDRHRARELLDEAIAGLPMDLRPVFVLFELEQMTMAAIATALSLPPGTVASRLRRAREAFQVSVDELRRRVESGRVP